MASSMTSSTEADLTQVIPLLVDGIAQEIGAERRDMRVTFVADHRQHDLSSWSQLKYQLMPETSFVWQRPNDLNHPRAYFEISLANEQLLMNPINTTNECVPKDIKGSCAYTEPGEPAPLWQAGSYGSALSTLRTKLLAAMEGPFTTKAAPRLCSVVQFQLGTHPTRMAPHGWIGSPIALEAFLHLHAWHARYPKDSGSKYCLELNTHSAGVYGIAFELHTVLHHQWRYDVNWVKELKDFDLLTHYKKRQLCESALQSLGYDPKRIPYTADPGYGHSQLDESGEADAQDYDAQISALMEGRLPPSLGPSSSGAAPSGLSGGHGFPSSAAPPTAKAMPKSSSTSTTRPCPTSQGGQATKIRKIQDVMKNTVPMTPTPSSSRYRQMPPISQQACRKACEAIDHGMGQGYSLEDWYMWYLSEELTDEVMENLEHAWFPDSDIIRLVPDLTDFPFGPENAIVKAITPEMTLNPMYDPHAVPSVPPSGPPSDQSDPWIVRNSTNFPKNLVVRKGIVFGYHSITPNEVWNFMANGNTRLDPVHNNYFGSHIP